MASVDNISSTDHSDGGLDNRDIVTKDNQISSVDKWNVSSPISPRRSISAFHTESPSKLPSRRELAERSLVLLDYYSSTEPGEDENTNVERARIIDQVFENILKIRMRDRVIAGRSGANKGSSASEAEAEDTKKDSDCIACYDRIPDTVLIPCNHLVLCMVGFGST